METMTKSYFDKAKPNYHILNGIADLIRVLDIDNNVVFLNRSMEEALGCENGVCKISESILKSDITKRTLKTGEIIQREEIIDGHSFSVKCSPIIGADGKIAGAVEVFRDTTYEKVLQKEIIDKNKSLTYEMIQASKIQQSLLPKKGFMENIQVDYDYRPFNMLSGDIFDVFKINNDNIAVYIADAVGHGFASSMITMFIQSLVGNLSQYRLLRPSKAIAEVSRKFGELNLDIDNYFTFFYGVYNRKTGNFTFSNAGHFPCPIVYNGENIINLETSGYPITRFFTNCEYEDYIIKLNCSDKILFLTDGITETQNIKQESFGTDKICEILRKNNIDELKLIRKELNDFMWADGNDDMTALLLKIW